MLLSGEELMEDGSGLPVDPAELQSIIELAEEKTLDLRERIAEEERKMERYHVSVCCTYRCV